VLQSFKANREKLAQKNRNASTNVLNDMSMLPNVTNAPSKPPVADNASNTYPISSYTLNKN
jgi:cell cycle checkpoint control protein RAD9A